MLLGVLQPLRAGSCGLLVGLFSFLIVLLAAPERVAAFVIVLPAGVQLCPGIAELFLGGLPGRSQGCFSGLQLLPAVAQRLLSGGKLSLRLGQGSLQGKKRLLVEGKGGVVHGDPRGNERFHLGVLRLQGGGVVLRLLPQGRGLRLALLQDSCVLVQFSLFFGQLLPAVFEPAGAFLLCGGVIRLALIQIPLGLPQLPAAGVKLRFRGLQLGPAVFQGGLIVRPGPAQGSAALHQGDGRGLQLAFRLTQLPLRVAPGLVQLRPGVVQLLLSV